MCACVADMLMVVIDDVDDNVVAVWHWQYPYYRYGCLL